MNGVKIFRIKDSSCETIANRWRSTTFDHDPRSPSSRLKTQHKVLIRWPAFRHNIRWIETRSNNHHRRGGRAGAKFVGALKFSAGLLA